LTLAKAVLLEVRYQKVHRLDRLCKELLMFDDGAFGANRKVLLEFKILE